MLEQLHKVVITRQISTDPSFKGVISALRRPATKQFGDVYDLDKKQTSTADLLGTLRLSLLCLSPSDSSSPPLPSQPTFPGFIRRRYLIREAKENIRKCIEIPYSLRTPHTAQARAIRRIEPSEEMGRFNRICSL